MSDSPSTTCLFVSSQAFVFSAFRCFDSYYSCRAHILVTQFIAFFPAAIIPAFSVFLVDSVTLHKVYQQLSPHTDLRRFPAVSCAVRSFSHLKRRVITSVFCSFLHPHTAILHSHHPRSIMHSSSQFAFFVCIINKILNKPFSHTSTLSLR